MSKIISSTTVKFGGWAGVLAAVLLILSTVVSQVSPVGTLYRSVSDYLHQVLLLLAYAAAVVAILGLHALQHGHRRYGQLGTAATVLAVIGYAAVAMIILAGIVSGSRVLQEVRMGAALVLLVGSVLLGVAVLWARVVPWWCGVLLIVAFPLGDVANQVYAGAEGILLALLWGLTGAALLRSKPSKSGVEQPEPQIQIARPGHIGTSGDR